MTLFAQSIVSGLVTGAVIALLALSIVVIHRSTRVLSFAQGAIASLATYVYFQLQTVWGVPVLLALPLGVLAGAAVGAAVERAAMDPLRRADALTRTAATLGVVLVLQVIMRTVWGGHESFVRRVASGGVSAGSFSLDAQSIAILLVAAVATLALAAWLRASYRGLALSAIADDPAAARLLGVRPGRASLLAWSIGGALAALAGILVTPTLVLNPIQMTLIMVPALGAALLGRFMSLPLALAGGLLIGVVQHVVLAYVNVSGLSESFGFIAVLAILLLMRDRTVAAVQR